MKKLATMLVLSFAFLFGIALGAANSEQIYLTQILDQLTAIQPLILAAQKTHVNIGREQFHYTQYRDEKGLNHHGLLEDILEIKKGILAQLNKTPTEPHVIQPLAGDYLNSDKKW